MGNDDGNGHLRLGPGLRQREDEAVREGGIVLEESLHLGVMGRVASRDEGVVPGDSLLLLGAAEARPADVVDEEAGQAHVTPAKGARLPAPVDLLAVTAAGSGAPTAQE